MKAENEKNNQEDFKFLKNFHIFRYVTKLTQHKLVKYIKKKFYKKGQKVFVEGKHWKYLYLIKSGDFQQSKSIVQAIKNRDICDKTKVSFNMTPQVAKIKY